MKTIELNGVKYKLVPIQRQLSPSRQREHELFVEILEASQRRAAGDPQWQMTDAQWRKRWGAEVPAGHSNQKKAWETRRERYGKSGQKKSYNREGVIV